MTRVFVTADDFGLHADLNRAIAEGVEARRIHGVSVSSNGGAVDWPMLRDLRASGASIGAHLTWVDEPWLTGEGGFSRGVLARRILTGGSAFESRLRAEALSQIGQLVAHGCPPTHIDSHQHVHVLPVLWTLVRSLAREFSIPRVRVPWAPGPASTRMTPGGMVLQNLSRVRRREVPAAWPCVGIAHSGHNNSDVIARELRAARTSTLELVMHPGYSTGDLAERYGHWNYDWDTERRLLEGDNWPELLATCACEPAAWGSVA